MKGVVLVASAILMTAITASAADGVLSVGSSFSVRETADRMERVLKEKGMTVFNRIGHAEAAAKVGIELRDTELIIFGNPKVGSSLMKCQQSVGLDLPLKALIWADGQEKVWVSYDDPRYLEKRHAVTGCEETLSKVEQALAGIVKSAATD